jgi:hypothetical protein
MLVRVVPRSVENPHSWTSSPSTSRPEATVHLPRRRKSSPRPPRAAERGLPPRSPQGTRRDPRSAGCLLESVKQVALEKLRVQARERLGDRTSLTEPGDGSKAVDAADGKIWILESEPALGSFLSRRKHR